MTVTIRDIAATLGPDGLPSPVARALVRAQPSAVPLFRKNASGGYVEMQGSEFWAAADATGTWTLVLPWNSEAKPAQSWTISLPDGTAFGGPMAPLEGVSGPLTLDQLVTSYGWGLVAGSGTSPITAITGPAGLVNWRRLWTSAASYVVGDAVAYGGSSYIAVTAGSGVTPGTDATKWNILAAAGSQGPAGQPGAPGGTINWRGAWTSGTAYVLNDAVNDGGSSFACIAPLAASTARPAADAAHWAVLAQAGGVGPAGSVGPAGPQGTQGVAGPAGPIGQPASGVFAPETYGARADLTVLLDASMTAGSTTLTSASAAFTAADAGKRVAVFGAGPSGTTLQTVVAGRQSSSQVTLAAPAVTGVGNARAVYGTDDTAAIQAAINAATVAGKGVVQLRGAYVVGHGGSLPYLGVYPGVDYGLQVTGNDIEIDGHGATLALLAAPSTAAGAFALLLFGNGGSTDGSSPGLGGTWTSGAACSGLTVDCTALNITDLYAMSQHIGSGSVVFSHCRNWRCDSIRVIQGYGYDGAILGNSGSRYGHIVNCQVLPGLVTPVTDGQGNSATFTGPIGAYKAGIWCDGGAFVRIANCYVEAAGTNGIHFQANLDNGIPVQNSSAIGNRVQGYALNWAGSGSPSGLGIDASGGQDVLFAANTVRCDSPNALAGMGAQSYSTSAGKAPSDRCAFVGNSIYKSTSAGTAFGILIKGEDGNNYDNTANTANDCFVAGNYIGANWTVGVHLQQQVQRCNVSGGNHFESPRIVWEDDLISQPGAPQLVSQSASAGAVDAGAHQYFATYTTASGETTASAALAVTLAGASQVTVQVRNPSPSCTGIKLYRTQAGATGSAAAHFVAAFTGNPGSGYTQYTDVASDASIASGAAPPAANTAKSLTCTANTFGVQTYGASAQTHANEMTNSVPLFTPKSAVDLSGFQTIWLDRTNGLGIFSGTGVPENSVTAGVGSLYIQENAAVRTTQLWAKTSGSGNTGWIPASGGNGNYAQLPAGVFNGQRFHANDVGRDFVYDAGLGSIWNAPGETASAFSTSAGASLPSTYACLLLGASGPITLSTTTPIAAGKFNGQRLTLINTGANAITIPAGGNVQTASAVALAQYNALALIWTGSLWIKSSALVTP